MSVIWIGHRERVYAKVEFGGISSQRSETEAAAVGAIDEEEWDLYREVHKAARLVLFRATTEAGAADAAAASDIDALLGTIAEMSFVLHGHHDHERDFVDALVARHAPTLHDQVEEGHRLADAAMARVSALAAELIAAPSEVRNPILHRLYLELASLTAMYLEHLDLEERHVMPALAAAIPRADLVELTDQLRGTIPPPEMARFMQSMLPAMNLAERVDMLGGMSQAPPEIWDVFRAAAQQALSTAEFDEVAVRIGLS